MLRAMSLEVRWAAAGPGREAVVVSGGGFGSDAMVVGAGRPGL